MGVCVCVCSGTTQVSRYQKGKTNLDFTEATDSEWQWHQLGHMQVCTSIQTDNLASTPPLSFLQAGCPSSCPNNSVKALKAVTVPRQVQYIICSLFSHSVTLTVTNQHCFYATPFNSLLSMTTCVSRYQGKTSLDLNEARDDGV